MQDCDADASLSNRSVHLCQISAAACPVLFFRGTCEKRPRANWRGRWLEPDQQKKKQNRDESKVSSHGCDSILDFHSSIQVGPTSLISASQGPSDYHMVWKILRFFMVTVICRGVGGLPVIGSVLSMGRWNQSNTNTTNMYIWGWFFFLFFSFLRYVFAESSLYIYFWIDD